MIPLQKNNRSVQNSDFLTNIPIKLVIPFNSVESIVKTAKIYYTKYRFTPSQKYYI